MLPFSGRADSLPLQRAASQRPATRRVMLALVCALLLCFYACLHRPGQACCQHSPVYRAAAEAEASAAAAVASAGRVSSLSLSSAAAAAAAKGAIVKGIADLPISSSSSSAQEDYSYYYYNSVGGGNKNDDDDETGDEGDSSNNNNYDYNNNYYYNEEEEDQGDGGDDGDGDDDVGGGGGGGGSLAERTRTIVEKKTRPAPRSNSVGLVLPWRSRRQEQEQQQQEQQQQEEEEQEADMGVVRIAAAEAVDTAANEEAEQEEEGGDEVPEDDDDPRPRDGARSLQQTAPRRGGGGGGGGGGDDYRGKPSPDVSERANLSTASGPGERRLPQAIIIGVKKGGTRALLEFLRLHPDVRAVGSEPHFFDRHYQRGLDWYRGLMPLTLDGQITMEKTPSYFITKEAPERIRAMDGGRTRLIVVVRDPVTRAISDYTQTLSKRTLGTASFEALAFRNRSSGLVEPQWSALRIGLYADHLARWLRAFPRERMLFVSGERLVSDPAGEVGRAQRFLGLKTIVTDKHFYFNATKGFPCLKKAEGSGRPHCLGKTKGRTHPSVDARALVRLRDFYRPFNLKFYQMVGEDFGWE
ncbi:uncharacterized protein LOC116955106 [Petromyzon marinus]|uniref:uncharacterized protein LOC116955106 n=1 Tax=Petromyzon marinus TaxID=7757 RepID=UPI003F6F2FBE